VPLNKTWNAALLREGIVNFKWHGLRHTVAKWHRQAGTPRDEMQRLGGWKTSAMVDRFARSAPDAPKGAAARLDAFCGYGQRKRT
jgi:integrase